MTGMTGLTPKKKILGEKEKKIRFFFWHRPKIILMSIPVIPSGGLKEGWGGNRYYFTLSTL